MPRFNTVLFSVTDAVATMGDFFAPGFVEYAPGAISGQEMDKFGKG